MHGPDKIPNRLLKECATEIAHPLIGTTIPGFHQAEQGSF